MNKSAKSKRSSPTRRKKTIPQSEEELSDRRSTSSSDSCQDKKLSVENNKNQRSTHRTPKKRQSDDYELDDFRQHSSGSDPEWVEKGTAEENSSDSDPAWNPLVTIENIKFKSYVKQIFFLGECSYTCQTKNGRKKITKASKCSK